MLPPNVLPQIAGRAAGLLAMRAHMIAAALVHNPNVLPQINGSADYWL